MRNAIFEDNGLGRIHITLIDEYPHTQTLYTDKADDKNWSPVPHGDGFWRTTAAGELLFIHPPSTKVIF